MSNFQDEVELRSDTLVHRGEQLVIGSSVGAKSVVFSNDQFALHLVGNPTANRTVNIPDGSGTILTNVNVSAGTTSNNLSAFVISNSNNVSFGLNGSTITASATVASTQGSINISAGTTSNLASAFTLSNANGVSFGLNASTITASIATSLTNINVSAGTTSNNLSAVVFSNSNRVSFGLNGSTITAQHALNFSAGTTSQNITDQIVFSNSNRVSFGLNGSTITAQHALNFSAGTTSNNITDGVTFSNSNGVSFGLNGSTVTGSHNGITSQSNQQMTMFATGNTTQSSTGTTNASSLIFRGDGLASVGITNGSVVISVPAGAPSPVNFSAGTTSNNLGSVVFSNSNGVSFGLNGSTITASVGAGGAFSAGISNLGSTAGTSGLIGSQIVFVGTNGILLSGSVDGQSATITVDGRRVIISSYQNMPGIYNSSVMTWNGTSMSHAVAFDLPNVGSFSFLRFLALMTTASTTIATLASATATASGSIVSTLRAVIYSIGTGASSKSLQSVASGSAGFTFLNSISITNSTQYSITQAFSAQANGGGTTRTTQYSISNTNYSFTTNQIATEFSSVRFLDIPFAASLSAGPYWIIAGLSTSSASAGPAGLAAITNCNVRYSAHYGASQANLSVGIMGSTNRTSGGLMGAGSFSTAGGATTASLDISAISSIASLARVYFQMLRSA